MGPHEANVAEEKVGGRVPASVASAPLLLIKGDRAFQRKDYELAIEHYTQAIEASSGKPDKVAFGNR